MKKDKIVYSISTEDIYEVSQELFDRNPTKEELKFIEDKIGDRISWYDVIENLLNEFEYETKQKKVILSRIPK